MNTKNNNISLEDKLIEEFKIKFYEELGYAPIVCAGSILKTEDNKDISTMSLSKLKNCFIPFLPIYRGTLLELHTKSRKIELVELRVIFSFIAKSMGYTLRNIGDMLGKQDHSTVIHSIINFKNWISVDPSFRNKYNLILNHIFTIQIKKNESPTLEHTDKMEHQS